MRYWLETHPSAKKAVQIAGIAFAIAGVLASISGLVNFATGRNLGDLFTSSTAPTPTPTSTPTSPVLLSCPIELRPYDVQLVLSTQEASGLLARDASSESQLARQITPNLSGQIPHYPKRIMATVNIYAEGGSNDITSGIELANAVFFALRDTGVIELGASFVAFGYIDMQPYTIRLEAHYYKDGCVVGQ